MMYINTRQAILSFYFTFDWPKLWNCKNYQSKEKGGFKNSTSFFIWEQVSSDSIVTKTNFGCSKVCNNVELWLKYLICHFLGTC